MCPSAQPKHAQKVSASSIKLETSALETLAQGGFAVKLHGTALLLTSFTICGLCKSIDVNSSQ